MAHRQICGYFKQDDLSYTGDCMAPEPKLPLAFKLKKEKLTKGICDCCGFFEPTSCGTCKHHFTTNSTKVCLCKLEAPDMPAAFTRPIKKPMLPSEGIDCKFWDPRE